MKGELWIDFIDKEYSKMTQNEKALYDLGLKETAKYYYYSRQTSQNVKRTVRRNLASEITKGIAAFFYMNIMIAITGFINLSSVSLYQLAFISLLLVITIFVFKHSKGKVVKVFTFIPVFIYALFTIVALLNFISSLSK